MTNTNTNVNIFEVAVKNKLRFPFKGLISVEDLYDLSSTNLNSIFKVLNSELNQAKEESLFETKSKKDEELELKIEIIKHIYNSKKQEAELNATAKERAEKKQELMGALKAKQKQAFDDLTPEQLEQMIADLDK